MTLPSIVAGYALLKRKYGLELRPLLAESQLQCHSQRAPLFASTHFGFSSLNQVSCTIGHSPLTALPGGLPARSSSNAIVSISHRQPRPIGDRSEFRTVSELIAVVGAGTMGNGIAQVSGAVMTSLCTTCEMSLSSAA
jgi:hypothetical protein